MSNGSNDWNVSFAHIAWFQRLLQGHGNVASVNRRDDIIFEIDRKRQADHLNLLCCDEYTFSLTAAHRATNEFGELHIIYIGGGWCGFTSAAYEYCVSQRIGLYVSNEMTGALWKDDYWSYRQKDKDGNPVLRYKEE